MQKQVKYGIATGIVALIVLAALFLFRGHIMPSAKKPAAVADTLSAVRKLTPEIEDLSVRIAGAPGNADLYYARGNAYLSYGNSKYALIDYRKAYSLDSNASQNAIGLSECLFEVNDVDAAIRTLEQFLARHPDNADAWIDLGTDFFLLPQPRYKDALNALNQVVRLDIQNADAYFYKGLIYKELGDTAKAISNFQTCTQTDPDYYNAFMQLGILFSARRDPLAIQYFDAAIAINDTSSEASYARAKFLQDNGNLRDAIDNYRDIISRNPQDADAIYNLATIYYGMDSIGKAYRFFELAIAQDPARALAYYGKGLCAEDMKKTQEAVSLYTQALNLDPGIKDAEKRLKKLNGQ